jgi:hypothetical protein
MITHEGNMQMIEPFLLPVCSHCGGPTHLSHLEPNPSCSFEDLRTYKCAWCGAQRTHAVARQRKGTSRAGAARQGGARR